MYIYIFQMLLSTTGWAELGTYATRKRAEEAMKHALIKHLSLDYRILAYKRYGVSYLYEYTITSNFEKIDLPY